MIQFILNLLINTNLFFISNRFYNEGILGEQDFFVLAKSFLGNDNIYVLILTISFITTIIMTICLLVIEKFIKFPRNFILESTLFLSLLYILKINTLSRLVIIFFFGFIFIESLLSKKSKNLLIALKIIFSLYIFLPNIFISTFHDRNFDMTTAESCLNLYSRTYPNDGITYYVVGHAYGSHSGDNEGISNNLLDYFDQNYENIILTGDTVRNNNISNIQLLKTQLDKRFKNTYIAKGNHDISKEFNEIFSEDLHLISFEGVDIVIANFSTETWLPNNKDQELINNFLTNSVNDLVILFSHQLFWLNLVDGDVSPNGYNILTKSLPTNPLEWINYGEKNLIIISGDYGIEASFYCKNIPEYNTVVVASGIYDDLDDIILKLLIGDGSYSFELIYVEE
jgi:hypothetical protein